MNKTKKHNRIRLFVQAAFFAFTNSYATGFAQGKIYTGKTKMVCVPGLNCYSCPGARFACPIGSLQAVFTQKEFRFSCYVFGLIMAFGTLMGRFVCGWLCPFGLIQDLLHKIPLFKKEKNLPGHKVLVYLKYVVLLVMVFLLPAFYRSGPWAGKPFFCEYICPSGTLIAGIPLIFSNDYLLAAIGPLFTWKFLILVTVIVLSIKFYRPFCKYLCPLGAFYGFFNPISLYRFKLDETKCVGCGACSKACKMGIDVVKNVNSPECIRCGDCKTICPKGAITTTFTKKESKKEIEESFI